MSHQKSPKLPFSWNAQTRPLLLSALLLLIALGGLKALWIWRQLPTLHSEVVQAPVQENLVEARLIDEVKALEPNAVVWSGEYSPADLEIPSNWKKVRIAETNFEISYPPNWSFASKAAGQQGFCMKPDRAGSCQEVMPAITPVPDMVAFSLTSPLVLQHNLIPTKIKGVDGVVFAPRDGKGGKEPIAFLLRLGELPYLLEFDMNDPMQAKVFSSLKKVE